ncbi:uncharacterized protein J3R85_005375 [Psidium guajava]|nr:uncharacterized protein J3R85_005375 [Psidium guajava]
MASACIGEEALTFSAKPSSRDPESSRRTLAAAPSMEPAMKEASTFTLKVFFAY